MEKVKKITEDEVKSLTEAVSSENVTVEKADKVIDEIVDFGGRRPIPLANGEFLYIRNPNQGEEELAEGVYASTLFRCHKEEGLPFIAQIARDILGMASDPDSIGKKERTIYNQKEIEDIIAANKILNDEWEEARKTNKSLKRPEFVTAPEPIVDDGSESLKSILSDTDIGPFEKTQELMKCIGGTEFGNLIIHCAEYRAGRARTRKILQLVSEVGERVPGTEKLNFSRKWETKEEFDSADPNIIVYAEMALNALQAEVFSQDFLQKLLNVVNGGASKS